MGKVNGKIALSIGIEARDQKYEVIYTDTNVKVEKVIRDKTGKQILLWDTLVVRNLGGTAGNLTTTSDGFKVFKGELLLYFHHRDDITGYSNVIGVQPTF